MEKIKYVFLVFFVSILVTACGVHSVGVNGLRQGMSKGEVNSILGYPERSLAVNYYEDGTQEVLEYALSRNEVYAIEFWNGAFVGYERIYLNNGPSYIPPSRPHYPINRPGHINRPGGNNRPPINGGRPNNGRPNTATPTSPTTPTTRPVTDEEPAKTRDVDTPAKSTRGSSENK